ncbi:hypothetical protein SAY87_008839 [Trapa incisa]|uniref:Uncharacterized protein n=1 Tax=Trapa incisa TaxID=236973 RepID=A0AAN7JXS3_9MYRT|nr:hypothetical protein SAY87_008839 [Trapa incisa]
MTEAACGIETLIWEWRFLTLPRPSLDIYRTSIELELNLASSGDKKRLKTVRRWGHLKLQKQFTGRHAKRSKMLLSLSHFKVD